MNAGSRLPSQAGPLLFGALLPGSMSLMVSGVATIRAVGLIADFTSIWLPAWLSAWALALPAVMVLAPVVRRIVGAIVVPPSSVGLQAAEAMPRSGA